MTENENKAPAPATPPVTGGEIQQNVVIDLKKTIGQHLHSLAAAGMETLPQGTGRATFVPATADRDADLGAKGSAGNSESRLTGGATKSATSQATDAPPAAPQPPRSAKPDRDLSSVPIVPVEVAPVGATPSASKNSPQRVSLSIGESTQYGPSLPLADRESQLAVIESEVASCTQCVELSASRTQTVFGMGNITPRLVFLGEAPGADEDRLGVPFVGAAGKLLDKILAASKLKREEIYLLNTVKCRPPANRNPSPAELDGCWGYAERQLEVLQPEFICCLGSVAAKRLLSTTQPLGRLRQTFHQYRGSQVLVTYHPAYLLRTESAKKHVWEDMKMLIKEMGIDLTK